MSAIAKQQYVRLGQEFEELFVPSEMSKYKVCVKEKNLCASQNVIPFCSE